MSAKTPPLTRRSTRSSRAQEPPGTRKGQTHASGSGPSVRRLDDDPGAVIRQFVTNLERMHDTGRQNPGRRDD